MASGLRWGAVALIIRQARAGAAPGTPALSTRVAAVPQLVRDVLSGRYRGMTTGRLGLMALALLYVVSPADLIPEAVIPLLGVADDALVITWLATALNRETETYLSWRDRMRTVIPSRMT